MKDFLAEGRISLRKYRVGDEVALHAAVCESMDELIRWGFYRVGFTQDDATEDVVSRITNWNEGKSYTFIIEELPGPVFVGNCSVEEIEFERHHAGLGWWVRTSRTGRGIATIAGRLVAQAAFEYLQFNALSVYANADNIASRRVAEKIGAVLMRINPEDDGRNCAVYELKSEYLQSE